MSDVHYRLIRLLATETIFFPFRSKIRVWIQRRESVLKFVIRMWSQQQPFQSFKVPTLGGNSPWEEFTNMGRLYFLIYCETLLDFCGSEKMSAKTLSTWNSHAAKSHTCSLRAQLIMNVFICFFKYYFLLYVFVSVHLSKIFFSCYGTKTVIFNLVHSYSGSTYTL
jgi:hypothetical protein